MPNYFLIGIVFFLSTYVQARPEDIQGVDLPSDEWLNCEEFKPTSTLSNCLCSLSPEGNIKVNCDHAVFTQDFPVVPHRQPITHFSMRFVNAQNIPPQAFLGTKIPLKYLDLSHNLLRRLSDKSTEGLIETLEVLDLSFNLLGDQLNPIFSTNEFKKLPRLRILKLGNNLLSDIDDGILNGCLSMQEFFLDNNNFKTVPKESFKGPNSLKILDLSFNQIDELKSDQFTTQPSLLLINLKNNKIFSIQGNAFRGLSNLKIIDFSWNRIHRLNSDAFLGLTTLEHINLSNNYLTEIPLTALQILRNLKTLSLNSNLIGNLDNVNLKSLERLEILDLSRNRLSDIPKGFFNGMNKLRELNLGVNQLRTLPSSTFDGLPQLNVLNLMDNNLLGFPFSALEILKSLNSLNLDYNRISALTPMNMSNLTRLSISHNLIREIPTETFTHFPKLKNLNLKGNLIENFDEVELPTGILNLNLDQNHLKTIPRFQLTSLENLSLMGNQLTSLLQHNFVLLRSLKDLDISQNQLTSTTIFPNSFDGLSSLRSLSLANNKLDIIPKLNSLPTIQLLNVSGNHLREINNLENHEFLTILDLSNNQISNIRPDIFTNATFISEISLKNNKLTSFKGFHAEFEMLRSLDLSNNQISYVYPNSFEKLPELWNLNLNTNRLSIFQTEFLKNCKELRYLGLANNQIKNLDKEMTFANFQHLRILDLSQNLIEFVTVNTFLNSSQLQIVDFSENKFESIDGSIFHGIIRLELDLSNNYLSSFPSNIFDRAHVQKLQKIDLSKNTFSSIPHEALQKQYFNLESLNMAHNHIREIPSNLNILVNVKNLDLSFNPLDEISIKNILNEPKTVRFLNLANCSITSLPILETPFLRELNISHNRLRNFEEIVFRRTTLLEILDLEMNNLYNIQQGFPPSIVYLDLSRNPISNVTGSHFPQSLESLRLNNLNNLIRVDKSTLNLKNLLTLEIYNTPKLGYLDVRGLLSNLQYLENFDFEVKDTQIVDQIHPGLNARVSSIGLRGRRVRSISTGAFAGLTSPRVQISLLNTSINLLPSILVPVPMSSNIVLDVSGSKIANLSPPFLSNNIRIEGVSPVCDCNAVNLVKYLKSVESKSAVCSGPSKLAGLSVLSIRLEDLVCEQTISTTPAPEPRTIRTTTTTEINDIIWSLPTKSSGSPNASSKGKKPLKEKTAPKLKSPDINKMDNLIIGIVGGVVGLIILFIFIIVCFVKMSASSSSNDMMDNYPGGAASVVSIPPSKCNCPHSKAGSVHGGYMPSNSNTMRSNGKGYILQGPGSIYAMNPPYPPMMMGPPPPGNGYGYNHSIGPSAIAARHQQMYGSLPYLVHPAEDYDRR